MKNDFVLWARQYSKRLLTFIFCVWGVGAVIGAIYEVLRLIVTPETASMDSYYLYLAVPMTCGVTSYLIANTLLNKEFSDIGIDFEKVGVILDYTIDGLIQKSVLSENFRADFFLEEATEYVDMMQNMTS